MNAYEITYIVRPDLEEDQTREVIEGVSGRIQSVGGELIAAVPWNPPRRRMAYPIKEFGDGFYVTTVFRADPSALRGLENNFKLNDRLLRFLLVQATDSNIKQAQQRLQQQQAAAQRPAPPAESAQAVEPPATSEATASTVAPAEEAAAQALPPEASAAEAEVAPTIDEQVESSETAPESGLTTMEETGPVAAVAVEEPASEPEE